METLEHIPPSLINPYLEQLARIVNGYFIFTVPNEKGIVFLLKQSVKFILRARSRETYTPSEFVNATLGRMSYVERGDHKGFDHAALRAQVANYFDIIEVSGGPFGLLPPWLNLTVATVAKSRTPRNLPLTPSTPSSP